MGIGAVIMRKLSLRKINLFGIRFGQLFGTPSVQNNIFSTKVGNNRTTHKLFKYNVIVTKLSCLIVFM